jgi:hypothetical protein
LDQSQDPAAELRRLRASLRALEERVARLETGRAPAPGDRAPGAAEEPEAPPLPIWLVRLPTFVGRLLLVLGGAFLLRSITEGGYVGRTLGACIGLAYGLSWLWPADRAARRGRRDAATWHGVGTGLIVFPLLAETTARFHFFDPRTAAVLLVGTTALALAVCARHRLRGLASAVAVGAGVSGLGIQIPAADAAVPIGAALVLLGVGTYVAGRFRGWIGAIWISAGAANFACFMLAYRVLTGSAPDVQGALALLLALFAAYVAAFCIFALRGWHPVGPFEGLQTLYVLAGGFGAALEVARHTEAGAIWLGVASLVVACGLYLTAFTVVDRSRRRTFLYLTSIPLFLVFVGSQAMLPQPALPWAALATALLLVARAFRRATLGLHAALYATAAALGSGLLVWAGRGLLMGAGPILPSLEGWLALAVLALVALVPVDPSALRGVPWGDVPRRFVLLLLPFVLGGLLVGLAAALAPTRGDGSVDPGWWATLRTAALAGLTLAAGWLARVRRVSLVGHLVPLMLTAGGLKVLVEDFPAGRPLTLALSFGCFGAVLLGAPRLARAGRARLAQEDPGDAPPPAEAMSAA